MNKRILKLFNEAGFHQPEMERLGIEDKFEKFAELLVRECANVCKQIGDSHISDLDGSPEFGSGAYFSAKQITQHFGVEE